jgi:DCC-interacting protein 13 alpha
MQKLHLEDCLDDTPQAKAMLELFEKDTQMLKKFTKAFSSSCQKVAQAQAQMISAQQEFSYFLRLYEKQEFPLESTDAHLTSESLPEANEANSNNASLTSTLNQFANYIDEISTCYQVFATQMNDSVIFPLSKIIDNEFEDLSSLSQMYEISSQEEEMAIQKYLRLSTRSEHDITRGELREEVEMYKKKFHQVSMNYYSSLNSMQHKRKFMLIEPMLSALHNFKLFFKMGSETFDTSTTIDTFLNKTSDQVCEIKKEMTSDIAKTNQLIDLLQQDDSIYRIESNPTSTSDSTSLQKSGYLNLRSKIPFISKWDRAFYFIQNGFLMTMQKNEIAGAPFIEIKSDLTCAICPCDDRPFTFQINSQFPKKVIYFQANSMRERDEWIRVLQNAVDEENRAKLRNYKSNQKAAESEILLTNIENEPNKSPSDNEATNSNVLVHDQVDKTDEKEEDQNQEKEIQNKDQEQPAESDA